MFLLEFNIMLLLILILHMNLSQKLETARNFSNIDFFLKILPLKDHELAMSEM